MAFSLVYAITQRDTLLSLSQCQLLNIKRRNNPGFTYIVIRFNKLKTGELFNKFVRRGLA